MKLIGIILLFINTNFILAQNIADTTWNISNKVSIKAPKKIKVTPYYSDSRLHYSTTPSRNAIFTYNDLHWQTDSSIININVIYNGRSIDLKNYVNNIESDTNLTTKDKCSLVATRINNFYNGNREKTIRDHSSTKQKKIEGRYYYSDAMGTIVNSEKVIKKFLFIPYYKTVYTSQSYLDRLILIDSVIYYFTIVSKHNFKEKKAIKWKQRAKNIERLKPAFYALMNRTIIKEDDLPILIKTDD